MTRIIQISKIKEGGVIINKFGGLEIMSDVHDYPDIKWFKTIEKISRPSRKGNYFLIGKAIRDYLKEESYLKN